MATAYLPPWFNQQFFKSDGTVAAGCKLYTYESGTTTPKTMWTNQAGTVAHTNPITLDSAGRPPSPLFFGTGEYTLSVYTDLIGSGGTLVAPPMNDVGAFSSNLAGISDSADGAALVGFNPTLNYASNTVGARLRESISVKDYPWNAKGDGATDDYAALMAAFAYASSNHRDVHIPAGTYRVATAIVLLNYTDVRIYGDGSNSSIICYDGTPSADTAVIALENCSYCIVERLGIYGSLGGVASKAVFGAYITNSRTGAAAITQYNKFIACRFGRYTDAGVQIGRRNANTDVNTDGNGCIDCFADGSNYNATSFANTGFRVEDSNTNFAHWIGGAIANHYQSSVEFAPYARNVTIDGVLMFAAGRGQPSGAPSTSAHFWIRNNQSGPINILNITTELYTESFLRADTTSGGAYNYNLVTLQGINCTANYTTGFGNYAGTKVIDYQGCGSVLMENCRFGGSYSSSGVGSTLLFRPGNTSSPGGQSLITVNVSLYDGATWDVETSANSAYFRWIKENCTSNGNGNADAVATREPYETRRVDHDLQRLTDITLPAGCTLDSRGRLGRNTWKVTIPYTVFKDAATSQAIYFATLPAKTQVVACFADTTTKFAGLAGTIQASVGIDTATDLLLAHDVKTAAVTKGLVAGDLGLKLATTVMGGMYTPSWTGAKQPYLTLTSGTGNLGTGTVTNLTTGSVTVYLITETLP